MYGHLLLLMASSIYPSQTQTYIVEGTDGTGCKQIDSITRLLFRFLR